MEEINGTAPKLQFTTLTGSFEQIQSEEYYCEILLHLLLRYKAESLASLLQSPDFSIT